MLATATLAGPAIKGWYFGFDYLNTVKPPNQWSKFFVSNWEKDHGGALPSFYNAADYITWRKGLGTTYVQADYDTWRSHFGQTAGSGSGVSAITAVPEPATLIMVIAGFFAISSCRCTTVS